jgi:hypothetical protein
MKGQLVPDNKGHVPGRQGTDNTPSLEGCPVPVPSLPVRRVQGSGFRAHSTTPASDAAVVGSPALSPRLVNMRQGAVRLGCSFWTFRDYVLQGLIPVVELPPLRPREGERPRTSLRRVLVDLRDIDAFIETLKSGKAQVVESRAPQMPSMKSGRNRGGVPAVCPQEEAVQKPQAGP